MPRNPWVSKPHRFVVEELLDHYPVVNSPNSHTPGPAKARRSVPSDLGRDEAERKSKELVTYEGRGGGPKCTA
jgi:hypothetical protein